MKILTTLFLLALTLTSFALDESSTKTYTRYFEDTYKGIEKMRNKETGLTKDGVNLDSSTYHDPTSPTNMGLDLLVQMEALKHPEFKKQALENLKRTLKTMKDLPYDKDSGLFHNRYKTDSKKIDQYDVSTVDNINLAMSLWTMGKVCPDPESKKIAQELLERMDFNYFYNQEKGLFYGGSYLDKKTGKLVRETFMYNNFGSEARSLYSMGYALDLIKDPDFLKKAVPNLYGEMEGPIMKLWDGGAFQLLLPRLFINEENYSEALKTSFKEYSKFVLEDGKRKGLPTPASFSASQSCEGYNGKAGNTELVSRDHKDLNKVEARDRWDAVFTPHAAFLGATQMPDSFADVLVAIEHLGTNGPLYRPGDGWADGLELKGKHEGQVVPIFLALDQSMIALSIAQILDEEEMTVANRAVNDDPKVKERLQEFYKRVDEEILNSPILVKQKKEREARLLALKNM